MRPAVVQLEPRPACQLCGGARYQDIACAAEPHDPRANDDADAAELAPDPLAFAEMDPGPDLDPEFANRFGRGARTADRSRRLRECREESVARGVLLTPPEPLELASDDPMVATDEHLPPAIAELFRDRC